jgi:3'(2'), 5'-bisphosphate nucleotidase
MLSDLGLPKNTTNQLIETCRDAGKMIMDIFQSSNFQQRTKFDSSPVTEADERAETIILARLETLDPHIPVIAEESFAAGNIPNITGDAFWLVDAIDGTKEFIKKGKDFTVNVALILNGQPHLGVVHCPALNITYVGDEKKTAYALDANNRRFELNVRAATTPWRVLESKTHRTPETKAYLQHLPAGAFMSRGSSLKFCILAAGEADIYPRLGPTMEWDTAAGHAVLTAAGGYVTFIDGRPFTYAKNGFKNPFFIAVGGILHAEVPFYKSHLDIYIKSKAPDYF